MRKEELMSDIRYILKEPDDKILLEAIETYDYVYDVLRDAKCIGDDDYESRWCFLRNKGQVHLQGYLYNRKLFQAIVNLVHHNAQYLLTPIRILVECTVYPSVEIGSLASDYVKFFKSDNWKEKYYKYHTERITHSSKAPLTTASKINRICHSVYLNEKERDVFNLLDTIASKTAAISRNSEPKSFLSFEFSMDAFITTAYNYFLMHNLIEKEYDDIMYFLNSLNDNFEQVYDHIEMMGIDSIKHILEYFLSCYNESKEKRRENGQNENNYRK